MTFSNEGLAGALDSLIATCAPPPKSSPTSVVTPVAARDSATK
jgi:hypothetical protein